MLANLPPQCVEAFTGVSNVSVFADIQEDDTVLDLGCGAGLDSLVAAKRTGPAGTIISVDSTKGIGSRESPELRRQAPSCRSFGQSVSCKHSCSARCATPEP